MVSGIPRLPAKDSHAMKLTRRLYGLKNVLSTSRHFARFDLSPWWYSRFYYEGRIDHLRGRTAEETVSLSYRGRGLRFPLTPVYLGAMRGVFLDDEYSLIDHLPAQPSRILDLGANIGMAAGALSAQFADASFVLVEPDPRNVDRLRRTVRWNGLSATVIAAAVGDEAGELVLRTGDDPTCSTLEQTELHDHDRAGDVTVRVMTVDEILAEAGWDQVDLVKIDIEGMEEALLTRNAAWLATTGAIVMEIHPVCSEDVIRSALAGYGFELRRHGDGQEPVYLATRPAG
jgi:FkbM family methyltransferase